MGPLWKSQETEEHPKPNQATTATQRTDAGERSAITTSCTENSLDIDKYISILFLPIIIYY